MYRHKRLCTFFSDIPSAWIWKSVFTVRCLPIEFRSRQQTNYFRLKKIFHSTAFQSFKTGRSLGYHSHPMADTISPNRINEVKGTGLLM